MNRDFSLLIVPARMLKPVLRVILNRGRKPRNSGWNPISTLLITQLSIKFSRKFPRLSRQKSSAGRFLLLPSMKIGREPFRPVSSQTRMGRGVTLLLIELLK